MSYQVLALKYRPQTFDEVVGQPQVTQTLANAISTDRVAHAILLTGPRGTGKTTIARILAKAMNCKTGPTAAPCNTCKICRDITDGNCTDVFEIDGASNNSVEQIRDLRENVAYMPSSAVFKIYIIDEVHMLSTAAFNALLKTLEEPPDHVMFIFATTEVHKIPATILSRCQRHDLGRIPYHMISEHLKTLSDREGFLVDEKSIDLVAREADGSIRDALSLFDRILSASAEKTIEYDHVVHILGALDRKVLVDLCRALIEKDGSRLIEGVEIVHDTGQDLKKFFTDLVQYIRDLNVIRLCGPATSAVNLSDHEKKQLEQMGSRVSPGYINLVLQVLLENETVVRNASHPRTAIEMTLLKLLDIRQDAQIDRIIHHLDTLAKQIEKKVPGIGGSPKRPLPSPRTEPIPNDPPAPPEQKKKLEKFPERN